MNALLTDDDISQALAAAASGFAVPDHDELLLDLEEVAPAVPWQRRRGVQLLAIAAALVAGVLVVGSLSAGSPAKPAAAKASASNKAPATTSLDSLATGSTGSETLRDMPRFAGSAGLAGVQVHAPAMVPAPAPVGTGGTGSVGTDSARVVKTSSISLVVDDGKVTTTMARLQSVAKGAGGYLSTESTQDVGDSPSGSLTMRVPVAAFESVVAQISSKGFGAKVISVESSGTDVTADYADTVAQINSLKAARARYLTIMGGARTIGEVLSVQQQIDSVQGQLDRLEGSRRVLAIQSDLATLSVTVNEKKAAVLNTTPSGWSKAWHDAGHGFTGGIESLIAHSGKALLVLLVALAILLAGRVGWRIARRRLI